MSVSRIAASRSIQPLAAAASTMAYSPEMLYAATGHVDRVAHPRGARRGRPAPASPSRCRRPRSTSSSASRTPSRALARVLLVGAPVALQRGVDGLAERAVEGGGVLRGVGQDRDVGVAGARRARPGPRRPGRPSSRSARPCRRRPRPGRRAISAYTSSVASLSTRPSAVSTPQWPWSVNSSRHRSLITVSASPTSADHVGDRDVEDAVGVERAGAGGVLGLRDAEQHHPAEPEPRPPRRRPSRSGVAGVLDDARHRRDRAAARRSPRARTAAAPAGAARREVSATSRRSAGRASAAGAAGRRDPRRSSVIAR